LPVSISLVSSLFTTSSVVHSSQKKTLFLM
jgi:hypothetical protein